MMRKKGGYGREANDRQGSWLCITIRRQTKPVQSFPPIPSLLYILFITPPSPPPHVHVTSPRFAFLNLLKFKSVLFYCRFEARRE